MKPSLPDVGGEDGVHWVKSVYAANKPLWVYVLDGDFALWVDVGINITPERAVIPYLESRDGSLWRKSQMAIITHADVDHFGGLQPLQRLRPQTWVMAHAADKPWIESPARVLQERYMMHAADGIVLSAARQESLNERGGGGGRVNLALQGGEQIELGGVGGEWTVLHAPGHSPGHLVLWNPRRKWALIGDAALDWGVADDSGTLIAPPPYYDVPAYRRTLAMLRELRAERTYTSHYGILDRGATEALYSNSIAAVDALESALQASIGESPEGLSLPNLCAAVGRRVAAHWPEALWGALCDPLSAHLQAGIAESRLERVKIDTGFGYRLL